MTAIALLNAYSTPFLLADTLLTSKGEDPEQDRIAYLPGFGQRPANYVSKEGPRYIQSLGRKSLMFPACSGVMAFAGNLTSAMRLWENVSERFLNQVSFNPTARITLQIFEDYLNGLSAEAMDISLLGVTIDAAGQFQPLAHRAEEFNTKNFGVCFVAGSGGDDVKKTILEYDALVESRKGAKSNGTSHTEDLAHIICIKGLYLDSDFRNGNDINSPLSKSYGGVFEGFEMTKRGAKRLAPRLDLHISTTPEEIQITRAYWVDNLELIQPEGTQYASQRYYIHVLELGELCSQFMDTPISNGFFEVCFTRGFSSIAEPAWCTEQAIVTNTHDGYFGKSYFREVDPELLNHLIPNPIEIKSIRVVHSHKQQSPIIRTFPAKDGEPSKMTLSHSKNNIQLRIHSDFIMWLMRH